MPNWCENTATFRKTDAEQIAALAKQFSAKEGEPFAFLRPQPDPLPAAEKTYIITRNGYGVESKIETSLPDWYQWRLNNWGTKWEPCACEIIEQEPNELTVRFDTAWGPPIALYDYLHENGWDIEADYVEYGLGFAGAYRDGVDESWDYQADGEDAA